MGNTIARPRRRARVHSVNFRTLWWLVSLEAATCITRGARETEPSFTMRVLAYRIGRPATVRNALRVLRVMPERRMFP